MKYGVLICYRLNTVLLEAGVLCLVRCGDDIDCSVLLMV